MKIIGVTGTSGAGKTTICEILKNKYNAYVIDADKIAKKLSESNKEYLSEIFNKFGEIVIDKKQKLNRKELANIIYNDNKKRIELNNITFKYIIEEVKKKIAETESELVIIDAPLLFESNLNQICDKTIGLIANKHEKIQRICARDNIELETAEKRINIQKDDEFIINKCDYIIYNNSNIANLENELEKINNSEILQ